MKKLSIVLPCYNVATYMRPCIESIIGNTSPRNKERCEIIIVNDGATDNTEEVAKSLISEHNDWDIVYKLFENGGVSKARNRGLSIAQGEYVWFVDPDDNVREDGIEKILEILDTNENIDAINFGFNVSWFSTSEEQFEHIANTFVEHTPALYSHEKLYERLIPFLMGYAQKDIDRFFSGGKLFEPNDFLICKTAWQMVLKRQIIKDHNLGFREGMKMKEDSMFVLQYLSICNNVFITKEPLYYYYVRKTGCSIKANDNIEELCTNKKQVIEEKINAAKRLEKRGYRNARLLFDGSIVLSGLEIIVKAAANGWQSYSFAKQFCHEKYFKESISRLNFSHAPFKFRIPLYLLKYKQVRLLFGLLRFVQKLGIKATAV